jgi:hypothetical protein
METLEQAAEKYARRKFSSAIAPYDTFKAGAEWQKEQDRHLLQKCLTLLADINGLPCMIDDNQPSSEIARRAKTMQGKLYSHLNP